MSKLQRTWWRVVEGAGTPTVRHGGQAFTTVTVPVPPQSEGWTQDLDELLDGMASMRALGGAPHLEQLQTTWNMVADEDAQALWAETKSVSALTPETAHAGQWVTEWRDAWRWGRIEDVREGLAFVRWRGNFVEAVPTLWKEGWCCREDYGIGHPRPLGALRVLTDEEWQNGQLATLLG